MKRREFLQKAGIAAATIGVGAGLFGKSRRKRPNILLYVVDDQGMGDAGCYGNPAIKTPGLDYLAKNGTRFDNAFCTSASCSASRSVILSGLQNHANGMFGHNHSVHHFRAFDNVKTLPVLLSKNGYKTRCTGKYHVGPKEVYKFDEFDNYSWTQDADGGWIPKETPAEMADRCKDLIANGDEQPFFLYFCTIAPHRPFVRTGIEPVDPENVIVPDYLPDTPECRNELAKYYMSVERADAGLKRLTEILKETGQWNDTLVIYCSDNGIAFPGAKTTTYDPGIKLPFVVRNPYAKNKGSSCDAMVSYVDITPTILDFAGIDYETCYYDKVEVPEEITFKDGKPKNEKFHGRSFLPVMDKKHPKGWDEIYASHTFHEIYMYYPMRVVRERQYKLIWNIAYQLDYPFASDLLESETWQGVLKNDMEYYGQRKVEDYLHRAEFELYDIQKDPDEVNSLADDPKYRKEFKRLVKKLIAFQIRTEDRWLNKWIGKDI